MTILNNNGYTMTASIDAHSVSFYTEQIHNHDVPADHYFIYLLFIVVGYMKEIEFGKCFKIVIF